MCCYATCSVSCYLIVNCDFYVLDCNKFYYVAKFSILFFTSASAVVPIIAGVSAVVGVVILILTVLVIVIVCCLVGNKKKRVVTSENSYKLCTVCKYNALY